MELMESSKKEIIAIKEGMLKDATCKITQFHNIAKNAILGISLILSDIADKPKEYLESSGFNSIAEYTESVFGYKKAYTYKIIKVSRFISIKDINGEELKVSDLIRNKIEGDYTFDSLKDCDGFEYTPSQLIELIPLSPSQIEQNIKELDSSLTCKELRALVKQIINPPIETTATEESTDSTETVEEEEIIITDKERIMKMLEICSTFSNEDIKNKIINVFQKSLKALEK